jgi:C-terminal processing protease CtpA/Prc
MPGVRLAAGVALLAGAVALPQAQSSISKNDRAVVREMLHQAREDLEKHYYDRTFHGVDVASRFEAADKRLQVTGSINEATALIADCLLALGDSHTMFVPPNRNIDVDYGWRMQMVGDAPLVVDVSPDSDAAAQGLAPGDRVVTLNRIEPDRTNLWELQYLYRFIRPQAQQHLVVATPEGAERTLDVRSRVTRRGTLTTDSLVDEILDVIRGSRDLEAAVGTDVLVWKMRTFANPDAVDDAIGRARGYKTLVLDLRGNGGGAATALLELVSRVSDHDVLVAVEHRRDGEQREVVKPSRHPFDGRLFVLVDSRSASAAEMFARIVQLEKRGRVLGDRTAGAVMTSRVFTHSVGVGAVAFYATSITIGDVRMSDGGSLERVGVTPDELVLPSPADLATGRDPVLARAASLAGAELTPEQAGHLFGDR